MALKSTIKFYQYQQFRAEIIKLRIKSQYCEKSHVKILRS